MSHCSNCLKLRQKWEMIALSHSFGTSGHPDQPPPTDNFMLIHAVFVILLMPRKLSGQKNACLIFFRIEKSVVIGFSSSISCTWHKVHVTEWLLIPKQTNVNSYGNTILLGGYKTWGEILNSYTFIMSFFSLKFSSNPISGLYYFFWFFFAYSSIFPLQLDTQVIQTGHVWLLN